MCSYLVGLGTQCLACVSIYFNTLCKQEARALLRLLRYPSIRTKISWPGPYGPRREKTCLQGVHQSEFQTSLLSYRDYLENWNFTCSKFILDTIQRVNNKGADQTALMRRLVCACVVRKPPKTGFLKSRPIFWGYSKELSLSRWDNSFEYPQHEFC